MKKLISSVYDGQNRIPVDFQAVKSFFMDHEIEYKNDKWIKGKTPELLSFEFFKKPNDAVRDAITINSTMEINDFLRVAVSLKKMKQNRPYKINKLIRSIQYMNKCKKKYAVIIIKELELQKLIKLDNDKVLYT